MNRNEKIIEEKRDRAAIRPPKKHWPCSWNPPVPYHRIQGLQDRSTGTLRRENMPNGSVPPKGSKSNKRRLTSLDMRAKLVRLGDEWQVSGRSTDSLDCLLSKWSYSRSALPTDSHTSPPPTSTNKWSQWQTRAEHRRLKNGPPLTRGLNIDKNTPVFVSKLMRDLQVGLISSYLTADKLFPVNLRAIAGPPKSLLLEAKSTPVLIIKPRLILVAYTDDLSWYITSNQQDDVRS